MVEDCVRQLAQAQLRPRLTRAGVDETTPYTLHHSFASLLLHEGRSAIYVPRQHDHDLRLTLSTYGHVIDELDGAPRIAAEDAIKAARDTRCVPGVPEDDEPDADEVIA